MSYSDNLGFKINLTPENNGEGSIGSMSKGWGDIYADTYNILKDYYTGTSTSLIKGIDYNEDETLLIKNNETVENTATIGENTFIIPALDSIEFNTGSNNSLNISATSPITIVKKESILDEISVSNDTTELEDLINSKPGLIITNNNSTTLKINTNYNLKETLSFVNNTSDIISVTVIQSGETSYDPSTGESSDDIHVGGDGTYTPITITFSIPSSNSVDFYVGSNTSLTCSADGEILINNSSGTKITTINASTTGEIFNSYTGTATNIASGAYSHAEGYGTYATWDYSHASGYETQTGADYQTVIGKYNVGSTANAFEIGWGDSVTRKNIFAVGTDGRIYCSGIIQGATSDGTSDIVWELPEGTTLKENHSGLKKNCNVVTFSVHLQNISLDTTQIKIGTIPTDYIPSTLVHFLAISPTNGFLGYGWINTSGEIYLKLSSIVTDGQIMIDCTYIL